MINTGGVLEEICHRGFTGSVRGRYNATGAIQHLNSGLIVVVVYLGTIVESAHHMGCLKNFDLVFYELQRILS